MQFSKIKKRTKAFLAPCLQNRIDIYATVYRKFRDEQSRVWLTFDGQEIFMAEDIIFEREKQKKYDEAKQTLPNRPTEITFEVFSSPWYQQSSQLYDVIDKQLNEEGMFNNYDVQAGLILYPNLSIQEALTHENPFIRGFVLLDRRLGKRKLASLNTDLTPFEQLCYNIRLQAEKEKHMTNE